MSRYSDSDELTVLHKVKVPASNLAIGMYVCELDRPWLDSPFLFQGFRLGTEDDIKAVQEVCEYVYVDTLRTVGRETERALRPLRTAGGAWSAAPPRKLASVEQQIENARNTHEHSSRLVKTFMEEIRFGRGVDIALAKEAVSDCVDSICRNPDAMLLLTQLKNRDEYTSQHSMNVCIFSVALGRYLGMPVHELRNLGLTGLLHDMGKMRVPLEILNKPGEMTEEEFAVMKTHTLYGRDILASCRGIFLGAIDVAHGHHERIDGKGYPRGLNETQLTPYTKMVAIADTYDAITSDRVYQRGRTHLEAISILNKSAGRQFDPELALRFIECLGIYPAGSLVEMSNGEVALVIEVNPKQKLRPKVVLLLDADKSPRPPRIADLSKLDLDAQGQPYRIAASLPNHAYGLDIRRLHEQGLISNAASA